MAPGPAEAGITCGPTTKSLRFFFKICGTGGITGVFGVLEMRIRNGSRYRHPPKYGRIAGGKELRAVGRVVAAFLSLLNKNRVKNHNRFWAAKAFCIRRILFSGDLEHHGPHSRSVHVWAAQISKRLSEKCEKSGCFEGF